MSGSPDAVIRQWFQEVWNERREDAIDRLMTPDAQVHGVSGDVIVGPGNFKPFYRTMCTAFGEFKVEVVQTLVEGDRVAAYCRVEHVRFPQDVPGPRDSTTLPSHSADPARRASGYSGLSRLSHQETRHAIIDTRRVRQRNNGTR